MNAFLKLKPTARLYVVTVVLLGALTVAHAVRQLYLSPISSQWLILAGLTLLTGSFTVKVPSTNASLSVSETFVFAWLDEDPWTTQDILPVARVTPWTLGLGSLPG